jgi:hypothetical protein
MTSVSSQQKAVNVLKPLFPPGRIIEGWICELRGTILRDKGNGARYDYSGVPPVYEFIFKFPEPILGHDVWIWGHNYDFGHGRYSIPNARLQQFREGDWVRIDGVFRSRSTVEWQPAKRGPEPLSLGEITVGRIEKLSTTWRPANNE